MFLAKCRGIMAKNFILGKKMRIILILISVLISFTLTQCTSYDFARRITQQGNLLSHKDISRLQVGMTKEDAAILLGNSLLSPTFTNDRWDYAYTWRRGMGPIIMRHVVIYFSGNRIVRIEHLP